MIAKETSATVKKASPATKRTAAAAKKAAAGVGAKGTYLSVNVYRKAGAAPVTFKATGTSGLQVGVASGALVITEIAMSLNPPWIFAPGQWLTVTTPA